MCKNWLLDKEKTFHYVLLLQILEVCLKVLFHTCYHYPLYSIELEDVDRIKE